ncbi:MAG TPA: alpha/beta hydrolase [Chloroflexia bacterium]|nr:alpha/beta hydrolase [Chloroflexia bacterium]
MKRLRRALLIVMLAALLLVLIGPFLVPVPPLEGTVPPEDLADPDSRFAEAGGVKVHYKTAGSGPSAFVLLHGFGASLFSWHRVMEPLGALGSVLAFDRPAFGLTERPLEWDGPNPYSPDNQVEITAAMLDHIGTGRGILVGHSAGGTIAMLTALRYPERVRALILVDPAVYAGGGAPGWIKPLLGSPQARRIGPLLVRSIQSRGEDIIRTAWHDPGKITPGIIEGYRKPLKAHDWDRALWEFTLASQESRLPERLGELKMPVLVITGDDDRIVPTAQSVRLAGELPNATLVVVPDCGHLPHEECPEDFMRAVREFVAGLD